MYEKPQYFTSEGFIRAKKNPYGSKASIAEAKALLAKRAALKKQRDSRTISDEAAKALAEAIKGVMKRK
jgi:hypothetical protein